MRKIYLLLLLLTFSFCASSQSQAIFCPKGAVWTACYKNTIFSPNSSMSTVSYVSDSIAGTDTIKILSHSKFYYQCNKSAQTRTLLKQKGDTVFMYSKFTAYTWQILFNFACTAGQGWTTTYDYNGPKVVNVTVNTVNNVVENGMTLRQLDVTCTNFLYSNALIHERYGWGFPFVYRGQSSSCDGDFFMGNIAYFDQSFSKTYSGTNCNLTGIGDNHRIDLMIYPNPFSTEIHLSNASENTPCNYTIMNQVGQVVKRGNTLESSTIQLSALPDGIYFLQYQADGSSIHQKIIKVSE